MRIETKTQQLGVGLYTLKFSVLNFVIKFTNPVWNEFNKKNFLPDWIRDPRDRNTLPVPDVLR